MKLKNIFMTALLFAGSLTAFAQEEETEAVFNPHWYVGGQFGAQYTLGEVSFGDLISPNAQVLIGYKFNPTFGLRLGVDFWQSKGGVNVAKPGTMDPGESFTYNFNYVAPTIDATFSLTNLIGGYNYNRVVDAGLYAGLGLNFAFSNGAVETSKQIAAKYPDWKDASGQNFGHLWDGSRAFFVGRFGAYIDFKVSNRVSLGLDFSANLTNDQYNSKHAKNADWYFNLLGGIKVALGKTHTLKAVKRTPCDPQIIEKEVVKEVVKEIPVEVPRPTISREIFYPIRGTEVQADQMSKLEEVVEFLKANPTAKAVITSYADKGTGNPKINKKYAAGREQSVYKLLTEKYGIDPSRISSSSKGDTVQPFSENDQNRATIFLAE